MARQGGGKVTSGAHPIVKLARSLESSRGRKKHGLVLLEGYRGAEAALKAGVGVKAALVTSEALSSGRAEAILSRLGAKGIPVYDLPGALFNRISQVESPQGIALLCAPPGRSLEDVLSGDFVLVADGLQDPGNLGSVLRSAQAFHVDGVVTTRGTVEAANPKTVRAAAGAWPGVPLTEGVAPDRLGEELRTRGFRILVGDAHGRRDFREAPWRGRVALVLGSEARGAGQGLKSAAADAVRIPLSDTTESLNVAAAGAILLAEAARQRGGGG